MIEKSGKCNESSPAPRPYLDDDFAKELNYQLWVLKSSRFNAARRLLLKHRWSTYTITALSLYAITANLMIAYGFTEGVAMSSAPRATSLAFVSVVMAITILIISLLESSRQYEVRAEKFHDCGLAINSLYRELRQARVGPSTSLTPEQLSDIRKRYEMVLAKYENHEDIDYLLAQTKSSEWFRRPWYWNFWIKVKSYFSVLFFYHFAITAPPAFFAFWWIKL